MTADMLSLCIRRPNLGCRAEHLKIFFTDKLLSTTLLLQAEIHDSFSVGLIKNGVTTCLFLYQH